MLLVTVLACAAPAQAMERGRCGSTDDPWFDCAKTFEATSQPRHFKALGRDWKLSGSAWQLSNGREFLAFSPGDSCRIYGRAGVIRVKENWCDGPLIVSVRSVGPPTSVTYKWIR